MTDVLYTLLVLLKSDSAVKALIGDRAYGEKLSDKEVASMPRKNVLIVDAGGSDVFSHRNTIEPQYEIWSFGEDSYEAKVLDMAVYDCLKAVLQQAIAGTLIHSIAVSASPTPFDVGDANWPAMRRIITVLADERTIGD